MDPEKVIALFDSCWFTLEILKKQPISLSFETNPDQEDGEENKPEPEISKLPTLHVRSKSDQLSSMPSFSSDSLSPDSVLFTPHLQTIVSGKEAFDFEEQAPVEEQKPKKSRSLRRRTQKGMTKSLSDLEFEELKGFMDLGFEFSEDDITSSLVEIIPGLQRLGKKDGERGERSSGDQSSVPRPYLSEAWEARERRERENPLMNWKIPDLGNETGMKDSLKLWAHTVASAIR